MFYTSVPLFHICFLFFKFHFILQYVHLHVLTEYLPKKYW